MSRQNKSSHLSSSTSSSGASLAAILPKADSQKSRMVYILLALILPGLGLHNFYAGHTRNAIIQLLCTIPGIFLIIPFFVGIIWSWIEIFTVTKDAAGLPFRG